MSKKTLVLDPTAQATTTLAPHREDWDACSVHREGCKSFSRFWWADGCMVVCSACLPGHTNAELYEIAVAQRMGPLPILKET